MAKCGLHEKARAHRARHRVARQTEQQRARRQHREQVRFARPHLHFMEHRFSAKHAQGFRYEIMHAHRHRAGTDNDPAAGAFGLAHGIDISGRGIGNAAVQRNGCAHRRQCRAQIRTVAVADVAIGQWRSGVHQFGAGAQHGRCHRRMHAHLRNTKRGEQHPVLRQQARARGKYAASGADIFTGTADMHALARRRVQHQALRAVG